MTHKLPINEIRDELYNLALMYEQGVHPDGKNITKAIELYEKAAELGDIDAMEKLSKYYDSEIYKNHKKYNQLYKIHKNNKVTLTKPKKPRILYQTLDDECNICCELFMETNDEIRILTCGHMFHSDCLNKSGYNKKCVYRCDHA